MNCHCVIKKTVLKYACLVIITQIAFFWLSVIGESIPGRLYNDNARGAALILNEEGLYNTVNSASLFDNWTDAGFINSMLTEYKGNIFERAMANAYTVFSDDPDTPPIEPIISMIGGAKRPLTVVTYSRYWIGSKGLLKLLFSIMTYKDIRALSLMVSSVLMLVTCIEIYKHFDTKILTVYALSIIGYMYLTNSQSLAFCFDVIFSFVATYMTLKKRKMYDGTLFLMTGMLCAFPGYWGFPLITLTYPLIFSILMDENNDSRGVLKKVAWSSTLWGLGISATVMVKQILAWCILGEQTGTSQLGVRLGAGLDVYTRAVQPLYRSIKEFGYWGLLTAFTVFIILFWSQMDIIRKVICIDMELFCIASLRWREDYHAYGIIILSTTIIVVIQMVIAMMANRDDIKQLIDHLSHRGGGWKSTGLFVIMLYPVAWEYVFTNHCNHGFAHYIFGPSFLILMLFLLNRDYS